MLVSGTVVISVLGSAMVAWMVAAVALAVFDKHRDGQRRHWQPAESSTHW